MTLSQTTLDILTPLFQRMHGDDADALNAFAEYKKQRCLQQESQCLIDNYFLHFVSEHDFLKYHHLVLTEAVNIYQQKDEQEKPDQFIEKLCAICHASNQHAAYSGYLTLESNLQTEGLLEFIFQQSQTAAIQGNPIAQNNFGCMYEQGRGIPASELANKDIEAVKWYRKAAELGNACAQSNLGYMYQHGRGIPASELENKDIEAVKWLREAAAQGYASAQSNLGCMYQEGCGIPASELANKDIEAVKWYREAAELGDACAQSNLGCMYQEGCGIPASELANKDIEAVKWYRKAAELGYAAAQNNLGCMYKEGCGIPASELANKDIKAVKWFRKATELGNVCAQHNLGCMYEQGRGIPASELTNKDIKAVKWFREAAAQDYAPAQHNLGFMYQQGRGIPASELENKDIEAVKWLRKAAAQGYAPAQNNLGFMYKERRGILASELENKDIETVKWFQKAAAQGYANAQFNLSLMYAEEHRFPTLEITHTQVMACYWFERAQKQNPSTYQSSKIATISKNLTPQQLHTKSLMLHRNFSYSQADGWLQSSRGTKYFLLFLTLCNKKEIEISDEKTCGFAQLPPEIRWQIALHLIPEMDTLEKLKFIESIFYEIVEKNPIMACLENHPGDLSGTIKEKIKSATSEQELIEKLEVVIKENPLSNHYFFRKRKNQDVLLLNIQSHADRIKSYRMGAD